MAVEFFGTDSIFGSLTGWEPQNGPNPSESKSYANALGKDGDELRNKGYDGKTSFTNTYVSTLEEGNLTLPPVGDIIDGVHIDNVQVTYNQTGFNTMTVTYANFAQRRRLTSATTIHNDKAMSIAENIAESPAPST